jgi:hypothetical protein
MASEEAARRDENVEGAIYGTILATSIVAGLGAKDVAPSDGIVVLLVTGAAFAAAHVYARVLAHRIEGRHRPSLAGLLEEARHDWPVVQATFPPAVVLALGWAGALGPDTAYTIAAWIGVAALFGWGLWLAYREGYGLVSGIVVAGVNAAFGVVIVLLKILIE